MTITTKTSANGRISGYYVDGKRVSRDKAIEIAAEQREGNLFTVMAERRFELADGTVKIITSVAECKKLETRIGRYMYERDIEVNGEFIIKVYSDDDARAIVDRITEAYLAGYSSCKINVDGTFTVIESEANPADYAITNAALREAVTGEVKAAYAARLATEREEIISTPLTTPEALDAAVEAETELANVEPTIREKFLAAKEEIHCVSGRYLGNNKFAQKWEQKVLLTWRAISKEHAAFMLQQYGLTIKTYLAEREKWVAEEISRGAAQMAIEDQARNIKDKVARESKPLDTDNVFDLLPTLDELNDVEEDPRFIIMDDAEYTERDARFNHGERHAANLQKELRKIDPTVEVTYDIDDEDDKDVFFFQCDDMFLRSNHATLSGVKDGFFFHKGNHNDETASMTTAAVETLAVAETTKAKAVNFATELAELQANVNVTQAALLKAQDNHENATKALNSFLDNTAVALKNKLDAVKLNYPITLVTKRGASFRISDFNDVYVDAQICDHAGFCIRNWNGKPFAWYDTPAQIEKVIALLQLAADHGDTEFTFPTTDELNDPNFQVRGSLERAMEIALNHYKDFCHVKNLTAAEYELSLYDICRKALKEVA